MHNKQSKILFVLPSLISGGAQRTLLNLINHLDREKFVPYLALFQKTGSLLEELNPDVEVINLDITAARYGIFKLRKLFLSLNPNLIFSTIRYVNVVTFLAAVLSGKIKSTLLRETNNFTAAGISPRGLSEKVVGWSYRHASKIIALSEGVRCDIIKRYHVAADRVTTIHNPIDVEKILALTKQPITDIEYDLWNKKRFRIIAVGHMKFQKGFDLLIKAIHLLPEIPLHLIFVGSGDEEARLKKQVSDLNLSEKISFVGFQANPYNWMKNADLFVLSSRWEGFGHVIAEAMVCGTPVLSTKCPSGPDEIITDKVDGLLCMPESPESLAEGIKKIWSDENSRNNYRKTALESVKRFEMGTITRQYEAIFESVLNPSAS